MTILATYQRYLEQTKDMSAAACLTLAEITSTVEQPMTVPEVATFLRVSRNKVLTWIRSGQLRGYNVATTGRPKYRVNRADLETFAQVQTPLKPQPGGRPAGRRPKMETSHRQPDTTKRVRD